MRTLRLKNKNIDNFDLLNSYVNDYSRAFRKLYNN